MEQLAFFNKVTLGTFLQKSGSNLDYWVKTRLKSGEIIALKKGLFVSRDYLLTLQNNFPLKEKYFEYLANIIRQPSYLSTEYVLSQKGIIPESVFAYTSISSKTSRKYTNKLGNFYYRNIKKDLFCGFESVEFETGKFVRKATKAKALFDFIYLKKFKGIETLKNELLVDLRINWLEFNKKDKTEFKNYVKISNSSKMKESVKILKW
ncbi:hypothetical protein ISR94_00080 [Candidatus Microgenomates bacterium]|nr:hypothetical protein [Candidatus Microgenomates bacterium]